MITPAYSNLQTAVARTNPRVTTGPGFTEEPTDAGPNVVYAPNELVKLDLIRQQEVKKIQGPDGKETEQRVPTERSDFGVHLGEGLFYDMNGNLSFVPFLAFFAPIETAVAGAGGAFTVDPPGLGNSTSVTPGERSTSVNPFGPFNSTSVDFRDGKAVIDHPGFDRDTELRLQGNLLVIDPRGAHNEITVQRTADGYEIESNSTSKIRLRRRDNGFDLDPPGAGFNTSIRMSGNVININEPGIGDNTTIKVTEEKIEINPPGLGNAREIDHLGDSLKIGSSGWFSRSTRVTKG